MILRAAIVLLLMLNLGVAAWWLGGAGERQAQPANAAGIGQPSLRLVAEPLPASLGTAAAKTAQPVFAATSTPLPAAPPSAAPMPVAATALCLSFGPFADAAARDAVRPRLQALSQKLVARDAQARSARGWRVYMPPLASREAAQALIDKIKAAGINDWYIIANGDEANSIALGRYGSEDSARRREAQLAAKGFTARAEPLSDTPPQSWLDVRVAPDVSRAALAAIAPSRPLDCARVP
ncbi:MAG: SPOR domain-containing protein [Thermomonas sp.]